MEPIEVTSNEGLVYILTNASFRDGYVKIGFTVDMTARLGNLSGSSNMPLPFEVLYAARVPNMKATERAIHGFLADKRINPRREFFHVEEPERLIAILKLIEIERVDVEIETPTEEEKRAIDEVRKRRDTFNFNLASIPVGSTLHFKSNPDITAHVVDSRQIEFEGAVTSITDAAKKAGGIDYNIAGTHYWMFEGETLAARRVRLEEEA